MLSDPWRLRPAVPDVIGDDVSSDDDDDYYDDSGLVDAYEIARKVREANARLRADITPLESSRQRRVQFRDPIRAVLFFTPDGGEENDEEDEDDNADDDGEEDEDEAAPKAEDALARSGAVRRLVTAAVERRSSLTSEEPDEPSSTVMMTAGGPEGADDDDVDDDFEQRMTQANDSGDDVDSFESDDNPSVSEDITEQWSERKDENQEASVQEVSGGADVEDDRRSPDAGSTASASSDSPDDRPAQKPANSRDSSLEEAASSTGQEEGWVNFDLGANGDDSVDQEAAASGAPTSVTEPEVTSHSPVRSVTEPEVTSQSSARNGDASSPHGGEKQAAAVGPLQKESPVAKPRVAADRPSTSPATLTAIYGASPRPRSVVTAGRIGRGAVRGTLTPITASQGGPGSVPNGPHQRARSSWSRATRQTSLQFSARSARSVPSGKPTAKFAEHGPPQPFPTRGSTPKQVQRQSPLARHDRASSADETKMASNMASTAVVSGSTSTYALPRELKEELMRKKRRERELQLQRQAREESERRERALEAERAFRAWLAKKRRGENLTRIDSSSSRCDDSSQSESSRATDTHGRRAASSGAFEAWLRRKQRQQREEELRRTLRELDLAATEKPRRSRQEAQQVYLAWLERKYEEERQRRLAAWAERRGAREAALSARSLRILERYLRSDEFNRYPELVV
ncbi:protein hsr-9-like [Dermacentor albipictus]|uniref:protein hsr-9-like n=1 Tax=Dermacentor albipictus TaxID=60249 RepID=UPI0038FC2838